MRALLLAVLSVAVAHSQDDARARAEAPVRQVVQSALPAGAPRAAPGADLSAFLEKLPPDQRAAALRRLAEKEGELGDDPAVQGSLGAAYLSLGDGNRALASAERALRANPSNPDALAVKAQVLASRGDKQGAQALLGRLPADHPRRAAVVSAVQLSREGSRSASPSSVRAAGPSSMGPGMLRMLENSLTRRGESRTLDAVIKKVDPSARSLRDLQGHGVQFDLGQPDQKDAVELVDRDGQKTLVFHPSVLQGRDNHATAQVGRALEEFVADRDYEGVSAWLRKMGGRVTGVRVYLELAPGDRETKSANTSEQAVLNDRGAVQAVAAPAAAMSYPNMEGLKMLEAAKRAKASGDTSDAGVILNFGAVQARMPAVPQFQGEEARYARSLRPGG